MMSAELPNPSSAVAALLTSIPVTDGGLPGGDSFDRESSGPASNNAELPGTLESTQAAKAPGAQSSTTGWYGKLPAAGDFLTRRLPEDFREPWDRWLSQGMLYAKDQLGEHWESTFLNFSVWRFLWISAQRHEPIRVGILLPGIDRVGRLFPLTVAMPFARNAFAKLSIDALETRLDVLEEFALQVLEDDDLEQFDSSLRALPDLGATAPLNQTAPLTTATPATPLMPPAPRAPSADGLPLAREDLTSWTQSLGLAQLANAGSRSAFWLRAPLQHGLLHFDCCPPPPSSFLELVRFPGDIEVHTP